MCLNHEETIPAPTPCMEKLSSMKLVLGDKKIGHCCPNWILYLVLVCLGCYNKTPHTGGLSNRNSFFYCLGGWKSLIGCWQVCFLPGPLSLVCRWPPSHHVLTRPLLWGRAFLLFCVCPHFLPMRTLIPWTMVPPSGPHLPSLTTLKAQFPNRVPLGHQLMSWGGHNSVHNILHFMIQSIRPDTETWMWKKERRAKGRRGEKKKNENGFQFWIKRIIT